MDGFLWMTFGESIAPARMRGLRSGQGMGHLLLKAAINAAMNLAKLDCGVPEDGCGAPMSAAPAQTPPDPSPCFPKEKAAMRRPN
jgi:hypothetical protein